MEKDEIINVETEDFKEIIKEKYIIPIYQRPYTWNKDNIYKLINSIMSDRIIYLGNILIEEGKSKARIIDGQQRITTLLLLMYYLDRVKYNKNTITRIIEMESYNENDKLKRLLNTNPNKIIDEIDAELNIRANKKRQKEEELRDKNVYRLNFYYIAKFFESFESEKKKRILENILNKIKFVKITIKKGKENQLSTTEIFDAINTTGKPLECKDKFKVRLYNMYIDEQKDIGKVIDGIYTDINKEQEKIREKDKRLKEELFKTYEEDKTRKIDNWIIIDSEAYDVNYFLRLYQFFLVIKKRGNKQEYARELLGMNFEAFYDGLFDILFETNLKLSEQVIIKKEGIEEEEVLDENEQIINQDTNYESILENRHKFKTFIQDETKARIIIKIEEVQKLFEILKAFKEYVIDENTWKGNEDAYFHYKLFKKYNRYYWTYKYLPILYYYTFENEKKEKTKNFTDNFMSFIKSLSKVCAMYSICYTKQVNECKEFLKNAAQTLLKTNSINDYTESIEQNVNQKIVELKEKLYNVLDNDVTDSEYRKRIICLILAKEANDNNIEKLFSTNIDIEHIYAKKTNDEKRKLSLEKINGIGNLMILEYSYNRSIKDEPISEKISTYKKSNFKIVKKFIEEFSDEENFLNTIDKRIEDNKRIIKRFFGLESKEYN